jgi:hypothetical protein
MPLISARRARTLPLLVLAVVTGSCRDATTAENPTPAIHLISPDWLPHGTGDQEITVHGSDFVKQSEVSVAGRTLPTTYISRSELRATAEAADLSHPDLKSVQVRNPPPGGGTSNRVWLRVELNPSWTPVLSSASPEFVQAGGEAVVITLRGEGFVTESEVLVNEQVQPSTLIGPTEMTVVVPQSMLTAGGLLTVQVRNQYPVVFSEPLLVEVRNPVPVITDLSPGEVTAGAPASVQLSGSGFNAQSEVLVDGAVRPADYVSATTLQVSFAEADLRSARPLEITVRNPKPAGGTAAPAILRVVAPRPQLTLLPSRGAVAGGPGFRLTVHGQGFVEGSVIAWDGSELSTQYVSSRRLTASVTAAHVAAPRIVPVAVLTPAPGGGVSEAFDFAVQHLPPAGLTEIRRVPLPGADLVYNHADGLLYVAGRAGSSPEANSVTAIDPTDGRIVGSVFVGNSPAQLALSSDGRVLYARLDGESAIRRVDLNPLSAGLRWSVGAGLQPGDLAVVPGQSGTVVVAAHDPVSLNLLASVTVYDAGIGRAVSAPGNPGASRLEFLDSPSEFYGFNHEDTGFEVFRLSLDEDGVRSIDASGGLIGGFETDIVGAAGRLYGTDGSVVDPERLALVGRFPLEGAVAIDPESGRAFFHRAGDIRIVDLNTFEILASVHVPGMESNGQPWVSTRIVRWGAEGLAFLDPDELFIVRSPIFGRQ